MASFAEAAGAVGVERRRQILQIRGCFFFFQLCCQQAHAAVDIIAHTAGRDDSIRELGGDHAADRETISLMHVGHGQCVFDNSRKGGCIDQLFQTSIALYSLLQFRIRVKPGRHAHVGTKGPGDFVQVFVDLLKIMAADHLASSL